MVVALVVVAFVVVLGLALAIRIVKQYEQGVLFRLGVSLGTRNPGFRISSPSSTRFVGYHSGS